MRFYGTPATIYEAGQVHTTLFGLSDNSYVHVMGLPTIDPTLECGGTNSTLEFNLIGTLQKVNGSTASGTNLTALNWDKAETSRFPAKPTIGAEPAASPASSILPAAVPLPWKQQDIGSVGVAGGAVYCGGMFTVMASGTNIGGTADAFHFVYQTASNNCSIIAPISVPQTSTTNAQAGVMIRDSLNANAANAFIGLTATNTVTFQYRSSDGGDTSSNWVVVVKHGALGETGAERKHPDGLLFRGWNKLDAARFNDGQHGNRELHRHGVLQRQQFKSTAWRHFTA